MLVMLLLKIARLSHLPCQIGFCALVDRAGEHGFGVAILDQLAQVHKH